MKKLDRKLKLSAIIAISIAGMLGSIFILPGIAAAKTGSSIWLAFLIAAICILPAVLSKSELATAMPSSARSWPPGPTEVPRETSSTYFEQKRKRGDAKSKDTIYYY